MAIYTHKFFRSAFMKSMFVALITICALPSCASLPQGKTVSEDKILSTVYIVRHAEKLTGENPDLSQDGVKRAKRLAEILSDKNISYIYSTDYTRTKNTAAPLAETLGLSVNIYSGRDLNALAALIKSQAGNHLVVGHSNTTEQTAKALGAGTNLPPIYEKSEYDRLYTVTLRGNGTIKTNVTRYGKKYTAEK